MKIIKNYQHNVGSHCESGSARNLLKFSGLNVSEPMLFGLGSGVVFAYLMNAKGVSGFPITAIRLPMGTVFKNLQKLTGIKFFIKEMKTTDEAIQKANDLIDSNIPVAACVEMFYMKYLPAFLQVRAPFHFIVLAGRDKDKYYVSDPYFQKIGELEIDYLKRAWETHALFSRNNLLVYVVSIPENINWKKAIIKALNKTCTLMVLPPVMNKIAPLFGVDGIKLFAKEMTKWHLKYSGVALREGILFTPTILEEQGTGGGAFRMLYAAFLQESAELFGSKELDETAKRMAVIGEKWRDASRELIKTGKTIPVKNQDYSFWYNRNKKILQNSLIKASGLFIEIADDEKRLFLDLRKIIKTLKIK